MSIGRKIVVKQERVQPEPDKKGVIVNAEEKYPRVESTSISSSESIITEYIDRCTEENTNNPYEVIIQ